MRGQADRRSGDQLLPVGQSAADVSTDQVGVPGFHVGAVHSAPRQDAIAEARRESLDLRFDGRCHIHG